MIFRRSTAMHEYEFRLVVESDSSFYPLLQSLGRTIQESVVVYVKPHFRFRDNRFETKRVEKTCAVYHDGLWFRWVHSLETSFRFWPRATLNSFMHNVGNYQDPFKVESRWVVRLDPKAQLYTFRNGDRSHRLVFEWEWGTFSKPRTRFDPRVLLNGLGRYSEIYNRMRSYPAPTYKPNETSTRRSVTCVVENALRGEQYWYAHKLDGTFGLVYSYGDRIKEKWEGYECVVRPNVTLGDGLVFAAERMRGGEVYLLDVYQVRGHDTAGWCRKGILTEFLAELKLIEGYRVQTYVSERESLQPNPPFETDGLIIHDVKKDKIYKYKRYHSVDLVYHKGYFYLPYGRIKCSETGLEEGSVYEISTRNGSVLRKRSDRFKGNTSEQLENILKNGWYGPPVESLPVTTKKKSRKK